MKTVDMSSSESLLGKDQFDSIEMIGAIAKDLYKNMVTRIEEAKPELDFDTVHKLAILNAAEFCKQCIEETEDRYEPQEKQIMAMVGARLITQLEDTVFNKKDEGNS
jgi:hypothetical protein